MSLLNNNNQEESTARCMKFDERPTTPHGIRKYRKSYFSEPGKRVTHFGSIDDEEKLRERLENKRFGTTSKKGQQISDIFSKQHDNAMEAYANDRKESIYKTIQRAPLGKPYVRGHDFSNLNVRQNNQSNFSATKDSASEAKELIYSAVEEKYGEEEQKYRDQYKKSHNSYEPGEQKRRMYQWKNIDPSAHRFGVVDKKVENEGVALCLQSSGDGKSSQLTNLKVENFRKATTDQLGRSKNRNFALNTGESNYEDELSKPKVLSRFRRQKSSQPKWTAKECILGSYTKEDQKPDPTLGKATRPGWRNDTPDDRVYGCPSVKKGGKAPVQKSLSDNQNYGNEATAANLLHPSQFSELGIDENDFHAPREKDQLREILGNIDYQFEDDQFDKLFHHSLKVGGEGVHGNNVSVEAFRAVMNEVLDAADEGKVPEWW